MFDIYEKYAGIWTFITNCDDYGEAVEYIAHANKTFNTVGTYQVEDEHGEVVYGEAPTE